MAVINESIAVLNTLLKDELLVRPLLEVFPAYGVPPNIIDSSGNNSYL